MATVDIPGVGPIDKRVAIGIGVATAGLVGFIYWRRSQAPPDEPGVEAFDDGSLTDLGEYGGGQAWQYAPNPNGDVNYNGGDQPPRTNAEWGQRAQEALVGAGYDVTAASAAIGAYIAHQPLSAAQAIMIRAALGLVGAPPSGSFAVTTIPTTPARPTPTKPAPTVGRPGAPSPRITSATRASLTLSWPKVPGATSYRIAGPSARNTTTSRAGYTIGSLRQGQEYTIRVSAINKSGEGPATTITGRTVAVPKRK